MRGSNQEKEQTVEPASTNVSRVIGIPKPSKRSALKFVLLIGIVCFFADFTYEGARSVTNPFLAILGASGRVVGVVAGLGELLGYSLRVISGAR